MFKKRPDIIAYILDTMGQIKPLMRRGVILIWDEIEKETRSDGGIILLNSEDIDYRYATVIGVAGDVVSLKSGSRVVVGKFYGSEILYAHSSVCKMVIVTEDQIEAVLD